MGIVDDDIFDPVEQEVVLTQRVNRELTSISQDFSRVSEQTTQPWPDYTKTNEINLKKSETCTISSKIFCLHDGFKIYLESTAGKLQQETYIKKGE